VRPGQPAAQRDNAVRHRGSARPIAYACLPSAAMTGQALPPNRRGRAENRQSRFVIDGEAIIRGVNGYSDFNARVPVLLVQSVGGREQPA
jgi:hypothetical protein